MYKMKVDYSKTKKQKHISAQGKFEQFVSECFYINTFRPEPAHLIKL